MNIGFGLFNRSSKNTGTVQNLKKEYKGWAHYPVTSFELLSDNGKQYLAIDGHVTDIHEGDKIQIWPTWQTCMIMTIPRTKQNKDGSVSSWREERRYTLVKRYKLISQ